MAQWNSRERIGGNYREWEDTGFQPDFWEHDPSNNLVGATFGGIGGEDAIKKNMEKCASHGFETELPPTFYIVLDEGDEIEEIEIEHNIAIEGIKFHIANKPSGITSAGGFEKRKGSKRDRIPIKKGEKIERITGTYGEFTHQLHRDVVINTLKIHTTGNQQGYGPYGKQSPTVDKPKEFDTICDTKGRPIVGLVARHDGSYLQSIALVVEKPQCPCS